MSDKTTAAIAAEQQTAAAEAPAEVLPAVTLDELEQVDLGTVEQGERAPFRITDDRCADWAIRKIAEERSEYNRLKELADQQKAAAAAAPPIEARCLTLRQKLVEMRKACPEIVKKKHSEGVKYKYAKIYDVWEKITPIMNELGVDFEVVGEKATRYAENGDPVYWITMQTKTYNGDKLMFLYEADLTIRWINLDNDDETLEAVVHALGWNDDPAKAKGAAHTYALKYYLFEKFSIDQGEDDPDNSDFSAQGKGPGGTSGGSRQGQQRQGQGSGRLSDAQLSRLYKKAEAAGMSKERTNARILEKYKKQDPATLSRQGYDEICNALDAAAAQHNQQGGQG